MKRTKKIKGPSARGAGLIAAERKRQIEKEGWTAEHDAEHGDSELAWAAICYAAPSRVYVQREFAAGVSFVDPWPWSGWDKRPHRNSGNVPTPEDATPSERLDLLVKAGALIAAEIDRLLPSVKPRAAPVKALSKGKT